MRNSTKNSSKLQKQIKKIEKDVRVLEVEKEKISKSDILRKNIRLQIQETEEKLSKLVAKPFDNNNDDIIQKYLSQPTVSVKCEKNTEDKTIELKGAEHDSRASTASFVLQQNPVKKPNMVITSEVSTEFREGYCIVPHCNAIINLVDPEESIGIC